MGQHHGRARAHPAHQRRRGGEPAHGIAYKLLLSPSGAKFGKSEGGDSVWLDPARTTPYAFYQYWVQADDRDVGTYLRWFTEFPRDEVEALDAEVVAHPEQRAAQKALALDVTRRVHGEAAAADAVQRSGVAFKGATQLTLDDLVAMRTTLPHFELPRAALETP